MGEVLSQYKELYYPQVLCGVALTYLFLQVKIYFVIFLINSFINMELEITLHWNQILFKTFAIPGSIFLSIVSGYLFAFPIALFLVSNAAIYLHNVSSLEIPYIRLYYLIFTINLKVCFCSATGASFCYLLSYLAGRPLVQKYVPERADEWAKKVERQNKKNNILR